MLPARCVHYWRDAMIDAKANPEVKRGRPRQVSVRDAVLDGAGQLLLQVGIKRFSIDGVARLSGDVERDLVTQVNAVLALFRVTAIGPILAGLISEAQRDPELAAAIRERWLEPRRLCGVAILEA